LVYYCTQCGTEVDHRDRHCRICGSVLHRPSTLWRTRRAVLSALGSKSTAVVERPSGPPQPALPSAVKAEKPKAAGRSPEWSPSAKSPQEIKVTPDVLVAGNSTHRAPVLEKASITNRKSGTSPRLGAIAGLGSLLTKSVAKPPAALTEVEAKAEPAPLTPAPTIQSHLTAQAPIHAPITKPGAGPISLAPKLEELKKTEARIQAETTRARRRSSSGLIGYGLTGIGALSLVTSVVSASTVLAFIGLGLTFWGALLLFIRPRYYVRTDLMDSTALSSLKTIDRVITGLGYNEKGIYIPVNNPEKAVVFVPSRPLEKIPKPEEIENQTFVKNPEGITIVPPGMALANLFEKELGVKFTDWSLEEMTKRLPKLLIENLEMAQDCTITKDGDRVSFRFVESVFSEFCAKLKGSTKVCSSMGCPMCSAMACVLAQVTHRPVKFDEDRFSIDRGTVDSSYVLLSAS
jgi:hypothetical protein